MHGPAESGVNLLTAAGPAPTSEWPLDATSSGYGPYAMSMTQVIFASALGFIAAQGGLYGMKSFAGWLQRDGIRARIGGLIPSSAHGFIGAFIRYAAPVGASVALVTLGAWAVGDYLSARAARSALAAGALDPAAAAVVDGTTPADEVASTAPAPAPEAAAPSTPVSSIDPYADEDYKVHHKKRRAGAAASLEETLLQRSETKARTELMRDIQQHVARSQYDCEAADRAQRYLKAGLDVWGFGSWQAKYFPTDAYSGATLPQCLDIKNVIDPAALNLQSTVAQQKHP
jgi:hypothetical protein